LKGADATAYAIADNRTAELAEWDEEALAQQLAAIQIEDDQLLEPSGFDEKDILSMSLPSFEPANIDEQGRLDEKNKTKCPECGYEFTS
jgi:hypothetical protein